MRIAVCMKQVPGCSEGTMDEKTGLLLRNGMEAMVNPYDLPALETALQIKEKTGAEITVFTMGPEKAEMVLREAFARGADKGCLICDRAFAGADVLATAYTLMQAIRSQGAFELILCGRQTTDGDTAQVSGELAQWLGIPHCNWVYRIEYANEKQIVFSQETELIRRQFAAEYPCLLSVEKDAAVPRMPSLKLKMAARKKEITVLDIEKLEDSDPLHYGTKGSATKVCKIFPPERTARQEIKRMDGETAALHIYRLLKEERETGRNTEWI